MNHIKKWPLAIAVTSALALTGCIGGSGGGGGGGSEAGGGTGTSSPTSTLSGTAAKGVVLGGLVKAWTVTSAGEQSEVLGEATTSDEDGSYELTLPASYQGQAILIEVLSKDGTQIRCDLAVCVRDGEGKPTVSFGSKFNAPEDFELLALIPESSDLARSVNISSLTSIAANNAIADLRAGISSDVSAVARRANAQVANRFGLNQATLLDVEIIDITDPEAVAKADEKSLKYSLVSAAIADAPSKNMFEALADFIELYVETGIADRSENGSTTPTIEKVLSAAASLVTQIETAASAKDIKLPGTLSSVKTEIQASALDNATNGSTQPSQGTAPADIGSEGLVATKKFVQQIRDLSNLAVLEDNAQAFADEVKLVGEMNNAEIRAVTTTAGAALRAIGKAVEEVSNGAEASSFTYGGVNVTRNANTYSVKQPVTLLVSDETGDRDVTVDVDLVANAIFTDSVVRGGDQIPEWWDMDYGNSSGTATEKGSVDVDLTLAGSVTSNKVNLTVASGSKLKGKLDIDSQYSWENSYSSSISPDFESSESSDRDSSEETLVLRNLETLLDVSLAAESVQFKGRLTLDIDRLQLDVKEQDQYSWSSTWGYTPESQYSYSYNDAYSESSSWTANAGNMGMSVSGSFSDAENELKATANINVANAAYGCSKTFEWFGSSLTGSGWSQNDECSVLESGSTKPLADLTVIFDLKLSGSSPIKATVNAKSDGLENYTGSATLNYENGMALELNYLGRDQNDIQNATLANHNGVMLKLSEKPDSSAQGNVIWAEKEYAKVDTDTGAVRIRYNDGSFEMY